MKRKRIILASFLLALASLSSCVRIDKDIETDTKESTNNSSNKNESTSKKETSTIDSTTTNKETSTTETTTETTTNTTDNVEYVTINFVVSGNLEDVTIKKGEKVSEPTKPIKEGYVFKGWYLNSSGTGEVFDFDTAITSNITLFAKFTKELNKYTVSFSIDGVITNETVEENSKALEPVTPTKEGYTFKGWSLTNDINGKIFDFNTLITSNLTLYAIFEKEPMKYTVTFNVDGITSNVEVLENNKVTKPNDPTKEGYVFKGWYENLSDSKSFDFDTEITSNITLYALFEESIEDLYGSYEEGLYVEWDDTSLDNVSVYYKKTQDDTYTLVDSNLVRLDSTNQRVRVDIVGLSKGEYQIKYIKSDLSTNVTSSLSVVNYDRSGYAHFNYASDSTGVDVSSGIGAYTNSGVLKSDTTVVYVTDETKNTVTANIGGKTYTGLSAILQAQNDSSTPLNIRIIGSINAATWNQIDYKVNGVTAITPDDVIGANGIALPKKSLDESTIISSGYNNLETTYTKLNGLTNKIKYDSSKNEFDSYYNMLDVKNVKNVTVEGIGTDATIFQWGFTWKNASSIEIRNLTFDDYTEDACSFEGTDDSDTLQGFTSGHIWIHNNQFNEGVNYWDVCNEQDKHEGDGATDFKKNAFITVAYNHYVKNHKTGLVGGNNSQHTACLTFHHNYYEECASRLPLARQANMHMYNNYYYKSSSYSMSIRANGYAFLENNYFEGGQNPYELQVDSSNGNGYVKALNNIFDNVTITADTYYGVNNVTSRLETISNTNVYSTTFDTDSGLFYFDDVNKVSLVEQLDTAEKAKENCIKYAGVHKN